MIHMCVMHLHVFLITSIVALLRNLNYVLYKVIGALYSSYYTELKLTKILIFAQNVNLTERKKTLYGIELICVLSLSSKMFL